MGFFKFVWGSPKSPMDVLYVGAENLQPLPVIICKFSHRPGMHSYHLIWNRLVLLLKTLQIPEVVSIRGEDEMGLFREGRFVSFQGFSKGIEFRRLFVCLGVDL